MHASRVDTPRYVCVWVCIDMYWQCIWSRHAVSNLYNRIHTVIRIAGQVLEMQRWNVAFWKSVNDPVSFRCFPKISLTRVLCYYTLCFFYIICPLDEEVATLLTLERELSCNKWNFLRDVSSPCFHYFHHIWTTPKTSSAQLKHMWQEHLGKLKGLTCFLRNLVLNHHFYPFFESKKNTKKNIFLEVWGTKKSPNTPITNL